MTAERRRDRTPGGRMLRELLDQAHLADALGVRPSTIHMASWQAALLFARECPELAAQLLTAFDGAYSLSAGRADELRALALRVVGMIREVGES